MPLDRARADEKLCADLGVRAPLGGEPCDLRLLRGEAVARLGAALAHRLAGGHPLTAGAFGEPVHADLRIHAVRNPELLARVHAPAFASQPLTVEQVRTRKRGTHPRAAQPRDRLAVQALGNVGLAEQRARARLDAERPVRAGGTADLLEPSQRAGRALGVAAACGRLDELGRHPRRHTQLVRVAYGLLGGGKRLLVAAEAIEENGARPLGGDKPEPLATMHHLAPRGVDQRRGLRLLTAKGGQDRALRRQAATGRLRDGLGLHDQGLRRDEVAEEELHAEALRQRDRQERQFAGLPREAHLTLGELVPARLVAKRAGGAACEPEPAQRVLVRHRLVTERTERALERRHTGRVAVDRDQGDPLEQDVASARRAPRRFAPVCGQHRLGDLARAAATREPVGEQRCRKGIQVRLARERAVQRLQPLGGLEQQLRCVAAPGDRERHLGAKQLRPRLIELIERSGLSKGEQAQRCIRRAGALLALCRGERTAGAARRLRRQLRRTLEKSRGRGEAAAALCAAGRALELGGDVLVGCRGPVRAVPGAPVRVPLGVGCFGEGAMHTVAVVGRSRAVGGGADEWVRELDPPPAYLEQRGVDRGAGRGHLEAEGRGGTVKQHGIAQRLRGRGEDEQLRLGREQLEAPGVALFDLADDRLTCRETESTGEFCGVPGAWQLEERERVAVALRDDLLADGGVERAVHVVEQQRECIAVAESADGQLGEPDEDILAAARARRADERDPLGEETAGDEAEDLRGGLVEPLRVVDDADQRLLLGDLGEQRQRGEPHQEPVGRRTGAQSEHRRERLALRGGQPVEVIQHRVRRVGAGRCRRAPSPTRRQRPSRRAIPRHARTGSPAARSCPRRLLREGRQLGSDRRARRSRPRQVPRTRHDVREASSAASFRTSLYLLRNPSFLRARGDQGSQPGSPPGATERSSREGHS